MRAPGRRTHQRLWAGPVKPFREASAAHRAGRGTVIILDVRSPSLEARDIRAGVEIMDVDGVPAIEYARRDVEPYQCASTPQARQNRTFWYGFLRGPSAKPVRLKLRDAAGKEFERDLERQGYRDVRPIPPLDWRMLPQATIAYVALNDFSTDDLVSCPSGS